MENLFDRILLDPLAQLTLRQMLEAAMQQFYAFTLVLVRMAGLMTIGPIFGQRIVPTNIRVFLVLTMSLLITPTLHDQSRRGFERLDADANGLLIREEVPDNLLPRFDRLLEQNHKHENDPLTFAEYNPGKVIPPSIVDFAWIGIGEFSLGLVLGLGVLIILSGLQLAGEIIDQQTGLALGQISNPGMETSGSITGQFMFLFGVTVLLLIEPIGGHLLMVSALVETFQTLPVGEAYITASTVDLLRDLVHQSLVMGVQVAAPLLATMSLVALTMGFLGHSVPQINILVVGFAIRALISLLVLALILSGAARAVVDLVPIVIDELRHSLTSL
ncbi:MAG: flagellar biosynthetic protein FliR [Planctomycetes bacterium]|nr:flagellar biosynthetic protein FliR [Planctomycetota bacterium]